MKMIIKFKNERVVYFQGTSKDLKKFCKEYKMIQPVSEKKDQNIGFKK